MHIIDHRILIPRSSQSIWAYISNIANNTSWQVDCQQVSFLTTRHNGVGVRWRCGLSNGSACVVEITAWYEGLGYEYTFVDGMPFGENKGRIRLQEIPEGTVVQWTFTYETKGLLGNVRNTLSSKRQIEAGMADSLRKLWRVTNQQNVFEPPRESKSLIRDAPDYEQRSRYKPRHPSVLAEREAAGSSTTAPVTPAPESIPPVPAPSMLSEPPLKEEDTRPNRSVSLPPAPLVPLPTRSMPVYSDEPEFLIGVGQFDELAAAASPEQSAWKPADVPVETHESALEPFLEDVELDVSEFEAVERPDELPEEAEPLPDWVAPRNEPGSLELPVGTESLREVIEENAIPAVISDTATTAAGEETLKPLPKPEDLSKLDTREISVFDLFGVPKPSETREVKAVTPPAALVESSVSTTISPAAVPAMTVRAVDGVLTGRVGLRLLQRRRRAHVRRPG